jgi:undecaprenyl-diphosphatase
VPDWITVILLGVIEGITEFLPVSSTGHLLIAGRWLHPQSDLFNVVIQSGAVLAVIPLFSNRCRDIALNWRQPGPRDYLLKLLLAFGLTGFGGLVLDHYDFQLPETPQPVVWALLIGGLLFLAVEHWLRGKPLAPDVTWTVAIAVGLGQLVAMVFPGASRSGTTILLALALGLSRPAATEFTFLVGIPTMLAAGGLKIAKARTTRTSPLPERTGVRRSTQQFLGGLALAAIVSRPIVCTSNEIPLTRERPSRDYRTRPALARRSAGEADC